MSINLSGYSHPIGRPLRLSPAIERRHLREKGSEMLVSLYEGGQHAQK